MGLERIIAGIFAAPALLGVAVSAAPAPQEQLIVTQMADPDPNFIPPSTAPDHVQGDGFGKETENAQIDVAMQSLGQAIGAAAMIEQQRILARCREGQPANATPEQRFAWAASCRYSRH